jgi:hypothetical protein
VSIIGKKIRDHEIIDTSVALNCVALTVTQQLSLISKIDIMII